MVPRSGMENLKHRKNLTPAGSRTMTLLSSSSQSSLYNLDMCHSVHFRKVVIETPTNAPLVYYTIYYKIISLHVSTLLGHHQGFTWNTKGYSLKCV